MAAAKICKSNCSSFFSHAENCFIWERKTNQQQKGREPLMLHTPSMYSKSEVGVHHHSIPPLPLLQYSSINLFKYFKCICNFLYCSYALMQCGC